MSPTEAHPRPIWAHLDKDNEGLRSYSIDDIAALFADFLSTDREESFKTLNGKDLLLQLGRPKAMLVERYKCYARSPAASADAIPVFMLPSSSHPSSMQQPRKASQQACAAAHSSHACVPHIVSFLCIHHRPDSADRKHKCHDARSHITPVFRQTPATNPSASQLKAVPPSFASTSFTLPPPSRNTTPGCNQSLWLPSADAECAERTKSPYLQLQTMVLPHTTLHGSSPLWARRRRII
ncbi:hypothetical protein B0H10DRAFT_2217191 [Mycena sp. CBHHK59/15]|nr:hypothetical protein B0H10DRAFT_2217191 [Mycena sp. CBHHK59/15]